ncbi:dUTPase [Goose adenovirus 4]|uniref:dUTP diphosphatase n=1 Tax=Goose adenovirus 4 TaxID=1193422 RepID=I3PMM0_9ADEN|nr:dUTPase [Goose adenovirus 4]AFC40560.1 deoxyuridine triphosphatase [Goose adenovirus 4]
MSSGPTLQCMRLTPFAIFPTRGSAGSVGYDLYSAQNLTIEPHCHSVVFTDLSFKFPYGCYGRIAPRSGLAAKFMIDVGAGVIDPDFRGNVGVVLFNFSDKRFHISRGDRIAQLICEKAVFPSIQIVDSLEDSERGSAGFGSTGR